MTTWHCDRHAWCLSRTLTLSFLPPSVGRSHSGRRPRLQGRGDQRPHLMGRSAKPNCNECDYVGRGQGVKNWVQSLIDLPHQPSLPVYLIYLVHLLFLFLAWFFCSGFYFPPCFPKHLKHTYFVLFLIIIILNVLANLIVLFLFLLALLVGTLLVWLEALVWCVFCLPLLLPNAQDVKLRTMWSLFFLVWSRFFPHIDQI